MKSILLFIALHAIWASGFSQQPSSTENANAAKNEKYWQNWLKDIYEVGIEQTKDSIKISADVKKIILDAGYRNTIYPAVYTIPAAAELLKKTEIKKAMWYLLNVYGQGKEYKDFVLKIILPFEQGLEMDKVLISTFYTYAMIDPQIGGFRDGKIEITRPDLLELKFNTLKEIVGVITSQRKKANNNAEKAVGPKRSEELGNLGKGNARKN